nr:PEGA domain-containing protein [Thermococcus sp. 21S7]
MKGLFLLGVLLLALMAITPVDANEPAYGILSIRGDVDEVTVPEIGTFKVPVSLVLPVGNYTVKVKGDVELEARVFVNSSRLVEVEFRKGNPGDLVKGNLTILGVKVTYDQWKNYPKYNSPPSLGIKRGYGVGAGYGTTVPYPMSLVDVGNSVAKLLLNNTVMPSLSYTLAGPFGVVGVALRNASFITPLSAVSVASDIQYAKGYLFNISAASMVTPFTLILPVIPHDVYNVTAVDYYGGTLIIDHIPKIDTYNLSVGVNHTLLTAVVKLKPREKYAIKYHLKTAKKLITVKEEPAELYNLRISTKPENARFIITDGILVVNGTSPATLYLPKGNYKVTAFTNGSGAVENFSIPETSKVELTLKPLPAMLILNITPKNASITIDGEEVNNTSVTLSPGEHWIYASASGYVPDNISIVLSPNESKNMKVALKRLPSLRIETKPAGALVRIKNTTCTSPCKLTLKPGSYTVEVSLKGYQNETAFVYLTAGESKNVSITLKPIKTQKTMTHSNPGTTSPATPTQGANFSTDASSEHSTALKLFLLGLIILGLIFALKRR